MTQEQISQYLAAGKHYVSFAAGAVAALGLTTQSSSADIVSDFDHIFNGLKEIAIGAGPLVTIAMGWWAAHNASTKAKVESVKQVAPTAMLIDAVADRPEVKAIVVDSPALAQASPSDKVTTKVGS